MTITDTTAATAPATSGGLAPLEGVLFFPVTPFDAHDRVDEDLLAAHVAEGLGQGAGAAFVACGTGEFHALDIEEYAQKAGVDLTGHKGSRADMVEHINTTLDTPPADAGNDPGTTEVTGD